MKILVINIALRPPPARKWLPIGLAYVISAIKRAGFEFDLLDLDAHSQSPEETERFLRTHRYDVVAMGCIVTGYKHIKWLSQIVKSNFPRTTIVVGNSVASSIPETLLTKTGADIAVLGEGDETIVELLECLRASQDLSAVKGICYRQNGAIKRNPLRPVMPNIDDIPVPDWDVFDVESYIQNLSGALNEPLPPIPRDQIRAFPINTARGCPYDCTFCYQVFRGSKYRWRSPASIIKEMRHHHERYGINYFSFSDELTFFSPKQAEAFADAMLASGLPVYWDADCRSGLFTKDEHVEIARKLKQAGAVALSFSLESANPDILEWMNKKVGIEAFSRQVEILKRAELTALTSIVIGYPTETEETIKATMDCCIGNGIYPSAGYLLPQPGTKMYEYAQQHGFIKDEEEYLLSMGDRQDFRLNMTKLPDDELQAITKRELARCSQELGLGLKDGALLKTGFYRAPKRNQGEEQS